MFTTKTYIQRRAELKKKMQNGIILFLGNTEASINYAANYYKFRQDSTFLYYFGLDMPDVAAIIDVDENKEIIFGNDFEINDIIWMGPQPKMKKLAASVGVKESMPINELQKYCEQAISRKRKIHFIPQYRHHNIFMLHKLLGLAPSRVNDYTSLPLIKAVSDQRAIKSQEEISEIEKAISISYQIHVSAMRFARPGMKEREVGGYIEGLASSIGSSTSFPVIFTRHGEVFHNHYSSAKMKAGDLVINDSGAETELHYASDITRTFPVSGKFTQKQKEVYQIVLKAQMTAIKSIKPGVSWKAIHLKAATVIAQGLKELGLMKGNIKDAVEQGAHALFFPHGLGHLLGMDVHDFENFGEDNFGYDEKNPRSKQFGLNYLRYAKTIKPGMVFTVEPGIYFVPALIDKWKKEKKHAMFINYKKVDTYRDFTGIRIEDDVLVTKNGYRVLGRSIPKTVDEIEKIAGDKI